MRVNAEAQGCWIDGHWGQYGVVRLCEIVEAHGGPSLLRYDVDVAMAGDVERDVDAETWAADDAERWLNDHVAPEGFLFGWFDGEFFLAPLGWWRDDDADTVDEGEALKCDRCRGDVDSLDGWTDGTLVFCGSVRGRGCDQVEGVA
jgi:hypothetical protein